MGPVPQGAGPFFCAIRIVLADLSELQRPASGAVAGRRPNRQ